MAFHGFPAEHPIRPRTGKSIGSASSTSSSTGRPRTQVTRCAGRPAAVLAAVSKPVGSARARRRAAIAPHLLARVRTGARFSHVAEHQEHTA